MKAKAMEKAIVVCFILASLSNFLIIFCKGGNKEQAVLKYYDL